MKVAIHVALRKWNGTDWVKSEKTFTVKDGWFADFYDVDEAEIKSVEMEVEGANV